MLKPIRLLAECYDKHSAIFLFVYVKLHTIHVKNKSRVGGKTSTSYKEETKMNKQKKSLIMRIHRYHRSDYNLIGFYHGDIAVTLHDCNAGGTVRVHNNMTDCWGQNEFEIIMDAFINMVLISPPVLKIESPEPKEIKVLQECIDVTQHLNLFSPLIVSNESGTEGAIAIFYPSLQEIIGDLIGDYYIIMPDATRAIIYPVACASADAVSDVLRKKLQAIPSESVLSKQVFCYKHNLGELHVLTD